MGKDEYCYTPAPPESTQKIQRSQTTFASMQQTHLDLEIIPLLNSQAIRLGNDRYNIDHLTELLHHNHVDGAQRMPRRVDEVQAAVDARILDVPVSHRRQFLAQIRAVLILDVLDDRVPATRTPYT